MQKDEKIYFLIVLHSFCSHSGMADTFHKITIQDLRKRFPLMTGDSLADDFFISDIHYDEGMDIIRTPCRFDGFMALFCLEGSLEVEVNLKNYRVDKNSVIINVPGNICRVSGIQGDGSDNDIHILVIAVSRFFLTESRLDFVKLFNDSIDILNNPCFGMEDSEMEVFMHYYGLVLDLLRENPQNLAQVLRYLVSSALYYAGSIWKEKLDRAESASVARNDKGNSARAHLVFDSFLKLVSEYHDKERGMAFYADKLCLTPKYLSKLVRSVSGRSGPEWIDSFVLVEAKNMLKYSEMSIKEIVYRLNFPNSSVFYKFFKSHTGQTPSEYRG